MPLKWSPGCECCEAPREDCGAEFLRLTTDDGLSVSPDWTFDNFIGASVDEFDSLDLSTGNNEIGTATYPAILQRFNEAFAITLTAEAQFPDGSIVAIIRVMNGANVLEVDLQNETFSVNGGTVYDLSGVVAGEDQCELIFNFNPDEIRAEVKRQYTKPDRGDERFAFTSFMYSAVTADPWSSFTNDWRIEVEGFLILKNVVYHPTSIKYENDVAVLHCPQVTFSGDELTANPVWYPGHPLRDHVFTLWNAWNLTLTGLDANNDAPGALFWGFYTRWTVTNPVDYFEWNKPFNEPLGFDTLRQGKIEDPQPTNQPPWYWPPAPVFMNWYEYRTFKQPNQPTSGDPCSYRPSASSRCWGWLSESTAASIYPLLNHTVDLIPNNGLRASIDRPINELSNPFTINATGNANITSGFGNTCDEYIGETYYQWIFP